MEGAAMDFHSLARRELQALCKQNKIPANMTNAAMADALKSLQHVEGIEEFLNPGESETPESPEKLMNGSVSMDIPRTATRTTTRRKPIKEDAESVQPTTRARGGTRRRVTEDVPQTPAAVPSSRKRAPVAAASARQKTESVAYSTRRSVRLAEKQLSALSLNGRGRTQPIKIDDLSKEMPQYSDDVQENSKSLSGADDTQEVSEEGSEMTNDSEVVSDQNPNEVNSARNDLQESKVNECYDVDAKFEVDSVMSSEKGSEMINDSEVVSDQNPNEVNSARNDLQESKVNECYDVDAKFEVDSVMSSEKGMVEEGVYEETMGVDLYTKPEVGCEATDETDVSSGEKLVNTLKENLDDEMIPVEKTGSDDFQDTMDLCDVEKSNGDLGLENEKELGVDHCMSSDESDENSGDFVESIPKESSGDSEPELSLMNLSACDDQVQTPEVAIENLESSKGNDENVADGHDIQETVVSMTDEIPSSTLVTDRIMPKDNTPASVKEMSSHPLVSNEELKGEIPFSNWAVDPSKGHIPRPTQLPTWKSSSRMDDPLDHNKENIDNCDGKLEFMIEMGNNKSTAALKDMSVRKLTKMLKDQLQIKSNMCNNDKQDAVKPQQLGNVRQALQALPGNQD